MSALGNLLRHVRRGTLLQRLRNGPDPSFTASKVRWRGAVSEDEGVHALAVRGAEFLAASPAAGPLLVLGDGATFHRRLERALHHRRLPFRSSTLEDLRSSAAPVAAVPGILCAYTDAARQTACARLLAQHQTLAIVPFEFIAGLNVERAAFAAADEYRDATFVSPVLLDAPTPYELYAESLRLFEQKCGLRDYLDLYQLLRAVVHGSVPGDIAEFGSYRGHSGWLIARTLQTLGSDKRLFMFDMFSEFPSEPSGVDYFWNRTHQVDFAEVQRKLASFPNVVLVRGDFTQTLVASEARALALAYVDCDSYRATRFLYDALWQRHLSRGGALVCEDYGHPALLGARAAVHDASDGWKAFRFFSQFSGLHVTLKPGA